MAPPASPLGVPAQSHLYRQQAILAKLQSNAVAEPLRIYPLWATWVVMACALLVAAALSVASVCNVEVTSLGRGIMRANGPPQVVATQVAGTVSSVGVLPGDRIVKDQEIARLQSTTTAASLLEASRKLELAERSLDHFREHKKPLYLARMAHLRARSHTLRRRAASEASSLARMAGKTKSIEALRAAGVATAFDALDNAERVAGMHRQALVVQEDRARLGEEEATLGAELTDEEWNLMVQVEQAQTARDSLKFALDASTVRSPIDGVVGSISVRPGDPLAPGAPLGSVVSAGAPRTVVVYIPERDRGFIEKGAVVRIEVDQLPVWEFRALRGRVTRVASEIASERHLRDTLGDQLRMAEPMYRVDIALEEDAAYAELRHRLRPESIVSVRFTLRERRIITILFEPLYRWLR